MKAQSIVISLLLALVPGTTEAIPGPGPTTPLASYKYFRALSIDLVGRPPTRDEIAEAERSGFALDKWIDSKLATPRYAERLRRVYMDLLRLELPQTVGFEPSSLVLRRARLTGPDGAPVDVYFRLGQRRRLSAIDGDICFTSDEADIDAAARGGATGKRPISKALLDARTVEVKPWWLYGDYRERDPQDRAAPDWEQRFPGFRLDLRAFVNSDGSQTTSVRVCREEAQLAEMGRIYVSGRSPSKTIPAGRKRRLPDDTRFATANAGKPVSCISHVGFTLSPDCGCGVGLERCFPQAPTGFVVPMLSPLGSDEPFMTGPRPMSNSIRQSWSDEATHFFDRIFLEDRDVRELLVSRETVINGRLAQFYRFMVGSTYAGAAIELGYTQPEPLFDPARIPQLRVHDAATWVAVDRGPHAAGVMTMPVFLLKYGTRRARAHAVYQAFLCRDFVAPRAKLVPSTQPDLAKRPGCASCHRKLEPLAAFFSRIVESDWTYLPAAQFPVRQPRCASGDPARMRGECKRYYDPDFTDDDHATLRGAYASPANADAGPPGLAAQITGSPEFASCVAQNLAQAFLGRPLAPDEQTWKASLAKMLVDGGYRARPVVKAILTSEHYRARSSKP